MRPRSAAAHRATTHRRVRPRRGRIALCAIACVVTLIAVLGGFGLLPGAQQPPASAVERAPEVGSAALRTSEPTAGPFAGPFAGLDQAVHADLRALPSDSGAGRRIVFARSRQRVWLVGGDGAVTSTYLVSGSLTHNLDPGRYRVYSRSRWAVGVDDSGAMQYFVRFAHGRHAAIGFHSIPTKHGHLVQTRAQLGTPQSHGCIRQWLPDAIRLWHFAPVGTPVVVVA